ncbi:MAG: hypothetical protein AVDCRST_MAG39-56, partial [uncultured Sphingomonadaceae bacterium]
ARLRSPATPAARDRRAARQVRSGTLGRDHRSHTVGQHRALKRERLPAYADPARVGGAAERRSGM